MTGAPVQAAEYRAYCSAALPRIYGYLLARCANRAVAEDLTQDVFLAAAAETQRTGELPPRPWLYTVARNKLVDHVRRSTREQRALGLLRVRRDREGDDAETHWTTSVDVARALQSLPPAQRLALTLYYADGLSLHDVATALHRSDRAAESLISRGRAAFKHRYEGVLDD